MNSHNRQCSKLFMYIICNVCDQIYVGYVIYKIGFDVTHLCIENSEYNFSTHVWSVLCLFFPLSCPMLYVFSNTNKHKCGYANINSIGSFNKALYIVKYLRCTERSLVVRKKTLTETLNLIRLGFWVRLFPSYEFHASSKAMGLTHLQRCSLLIVNCN